MKKIALIIAMTSPFFLSACGGGGGDSSSSATPATTTSTQQLTAQSINGFSIPTVGVRASVNVTTTATSGLPVSYTTTTPTICTVSGNTITGVSFGTCNITANQAGNSSFSAAQAVNQSVVIGTQTISFTLPTLMVGESFPLTATATSNLPITFTSLTPSVCTVNGVTLSVISSTASSCTIQATQGGTDQYTAATPISITTNVTNASATVAANTTPPPTVFPQAGSTFSDLSTTTEGLYQNAQGDLAIVDGHNHFNYADANGVLFGLLQVSGQTWTLDGSSVYYSYLPTSNNHVAIAATGNGTFITKQSFTATTQSFTPSPSPLNLTYGPANGYAVSQSSIAGNWIMNLNNIQITLSINSIGSMFGILTDIDTTNTPTISHKCTLTGTLLLADPNTSHNLYNVAISGTAISNSGTACNMDVNSFQGFGVLRYLGVTSNAANGSIPTLSIMTRTSDGARLIFNFVKQS